jgi:DNA-binding PadR family transcriptional regulator
VTSPRVAGLSFADEVVLALLLEQPRHGWSLVRELAPGGPVGRIWSLSRPLTYRSIDTLIGRRLVRAAATEAGQGARRTILTVTPSGGRRARDWLATPVEHLRDVRTELLLKLVIAERLGLDRRPVLRTQQQAFAPIVAALERAADAPGSDLVDRWRCESARAAARFVEDALRRA